MITFLNGRRQELEDWHRGIEAPLSNAQRAHLRRLGIDRKTEG